MSLRGLSSSVVDQGALGLWGSAMKAPDHSSGGATFGSTIIQNRADLRKSAEPLFCVEKQLIVPVAKRHRSSPSRNQRRMRPREFIIERETVAYGLAGLVMGLLVHLEGGSGVESYSCGLFWPVFAIYRTMIYSLASAMRQHSA